MILSLFVFFTLQGAAPAFASGGPVIVDESVSETEAENRDIEESFAAVEAMNEEEEEVAEDEAEEVPEEEVVEEQQEVEVSEETKESESEVEDAAETDDAGSESQEFEEEVEEAEDVAEEDTDETASLTQEVAEEEEDSSEEEEVATSSPSTGGSGGGSNEDDENEEEQEGSQEESDDAQNDEEDVIEDDEEEQEGDLDEAATSTATTTDEEGVDGVEIVYVPTPMVTDENRYQFSVDECVTVGDGSFYCNKENTEGGENTGQTVFSSRDADGDLEIFFNTGRKLVQITNNLYDDDAPTYDADSNSIVWHRLIEGRYQIVQFDVASAEETVITNTNTNNMEPSQEAEHIVWQRWVVNNWEIVLYDGEEEKLLTTNEVHDLAPDIQGGYVIWHTNDADGAKQVVVYEVATGLTSYIDDDEGGQVVNPRFVLVYDTKFENGDTITKGFDPESGRLMPLAAQPGETPLDIPDTDPVGETRALIQNKSQSRDEFVEEVGPEAETEEEIDDEIASSTGPTLELEDSIFATTTDPASENLPLTDFDIIVEPYPVPEVDLDEGVENATSTTEEN